MAIAVPVVGTVEQRMVIVRVDGKSRFRSFQALLANCIAVRRVTGHVNRPSAGQFSKKILLLIVWLENYYLISRAVYFVQANGGVYGSG
jgi:hypothetical protein